MLFLSNLTETQRRVGQWLVGAFFCVTALAFLTAGDGVVDRARGVVSAIVFLALGLTAIPPTRTWVFGVTGVYLPPIKLTFLIVGGMLIGVAVAPPP